jgi:hypothetical protein
MTNIIEIRDTRMQSRSNPLYKTACTGTGYYIIFLQLVELLCILLEETTPFFPIRNRFSLFTY